MVSNGQQISKNDQFHQHVKERIPIQIYHKSQHRDIGFIEKFSCDYVKLNNTFYSRKLYTFVSRPGY